MTIRNFISFTAFIMSVDKHRNPVFERASFGFASARQPLLQFVASKLGLDFIFRIGQFYFGADRHMFTRCRVAVFDPIKWAVNSFVDRCHNVTQCTKVNFKMTYVTQCTKFFVQKVLVFGCFLLNLTKFNKAVVWDEQQRFH